MSRKLILLGMLSLVILAPGAALSLGLGDIRLNSYLNQPMDAEIALSIASAGELETLKVELAPAEAFDRYGLDRPAYLSDLRFDIRRTGPAGAVIDVRSSRPIAEPFVTFLVAARWSGGRMLREYTVLLDPPVFLPAPEAAVAEPAAVESPRPAPATRPVTTPSPVAAPTAARGEYGVDYGPVQRNDTLWAIAQRVRPDASLSTNQVMVALFRANPQAFDGNINRLRAGVILRVPSRDEFVATTSGQATAEVRRHNEDWRAAAPPPAERRLELAPPGETVRPTAPVSAPVSETAGAPELADAVQQLRSELADTRRLMEIKDAEIAALQSRLAELETDSGIPVRPLPTDPLAPPDAVEPDVAVTPEPDEVMPQPVPEAAEPARVPPVVPPAPSMVDRALSLLGNLWLWLVLAAAFIAGAVYVFLRKRGDDDRSIEEDLAVTGTWGTLDQSGKAAAVTAARTTPVLARAARPDDLESILVEESERPAARRAPVVPPPPAPGPELRADEDYQYPFEDTIAGETGINLDQTDPMAEADFHMAYGLYDQAAEIIKKAVEREPDRYDLRRKLLDICFVWGNADEFLAQAKAVREIGGESQVGDWAKVAIMGRQICPGEPMFAAGAAASVDVELGEAGPETTGIGARIGSSGEWLDFDVGESGAGAEPSVALGDTREHPRAAGHPIEQTAELNLEELGIDLDLGETGEHALRDLADRAPAFHDEMSDGPAAGGEDDDGQHTGTVRLREPPELSEEGFEADDEGGTLMMQAPRLSLGDGSTQQGEGLDEDVAEDDPTLSGLDRLDEPESGEDTQLIRQSRTLDDDGQTLSGVSGLHGTVAEDAEEDREDEDRTFVRKFEASDDSPTSELGALEGDLDLDLDLDALTQVLESDLKARESQDIDATQMATGLYRATDDDDDATQMAPQLDLDRIRGTDEGDTREMPATEMNEVGTKLDLARAYMDMGDPEGARSILEEVVDEGDEAQRSEARELLDSLD